MLADITQFFKAEPLKFIIDTATKADSVNNGNQAESFSAIYDHGGILIIGTFVNDSIGIFDQIIFSFKTNHFSGILGYEFDGLDGKFATFKVFRNGNYLSDSFFDWFITNKINPLSMSSREISLMDMNSF